MTIHDSFSLLSLAIHQLSVVALWNGKNPNLHFSPYRFYLKRLEHLIIVDIALLAIQYCKFEENKNYTYSHSKKIVS